MRMSSTLARRHFFQQSVFTALALSIQFCKALPVAEVLKIHNLIENVWNQFLYDPNGGNARDAKLLCDCIDEINSPLVGSYFDIGNHQKFAKPAEWIRQLGKCIIKMDTKDWGVKNGFLQNWRWRHCLVRCTRCHR